MTIVQFLRRADTIGPDYPADFRRLIREAANILRAKTQTRNDPAGFLAHTLGWVQEWGCGPDFLR